MKTLWLILLIMLLSACGKNPNNANQNGLSSKEVILSYTPNGIQVNDNNIEVYMDQNLITFVDLNSTMHIVRLGSTDDSCLSQRGIVPEFISIEQNSFSFSYVANMAQVQYQDLIGCTLTLSIDQKPSLK